MISVNDVILAIEYGMVACAVPCFSCLIAGIFWRVLHIFN